MLTQKTLTLEEAMRVLSTAIDYVKAKDHAGIAVFVVDKNGNAIVSARMDNRSDRFYRSAFPEERFVFHQVNSNLFVERISH